MILDQTVLNHLSTEVRTILLFSQERNLFDSQSLGVCRFSPNDKDSNGAFTSSPGDFSTITVPYNPAR